MTAQNERVEQSAAEPELDLMTKAAFATGVDYWTTRDAPQLGIRSVRMADGPHGLRVQDDENPDHLGLGRSLPATCFPPAVTLASSWDPALIRQVGAALGREARARGVDVVLGPGLNIKRSPLCGRNFEYFSEDPLLAGRLAGAMVVGLQSERIAASVKHFAVNNQETDRMRVSADVDARALREIYLRAFEIVVREANPWTVMCSYNRINGEYASQNSWLLTDVLKDEWSYDGVVISDWGAVHDPVAAVRAGLDVRMPGRPEDERVGLAASLGEVGEEALDDVMARLRLLGERTASDGEESVNFEDHHELARRAAAECAVLLHNDQNLLPLSPSSLTNIAVVGELAHTPRYQGAGSSAVNPTRIVSVLEAMRRRIGHQADIHFEPGYALSPSDDSSGLSEAAVAAATDADVVLLFLGLPPSYEAEGGDRSSIDLPLEQIQLLEALSRVNSRIVVSLSNGSAVSTSQWRDHAGSIVEFWLTGQAQGDSVVDILFGDSNPSGKLTETIPQTLEDTPAFLDFPGELGHVHYGEGIHVGYRWYDARGLSVDYPFGHGLSYTTFEYTDLLVEVHDSDDPIAFTVALTLKNTGARSGFEVVQVYVADNSNVVRMPDRELRGFLKVELQPGEGHRVRIPIRRSDLEHFHLTAGWIFTGGDMDVLVGASSRDVRLRAVADIPGMPVEMPLTVWSPYKDWLNHPMAGPAVRRVIEGGGGLKGRMAELFSDPISRDAVLSIPMATLCDFPGFPVSDVVAQSILQKLP